MTNKKMQSKITPDQFLRSINICFDADKPERIGHFRPTSKTIPLLFDLLGQNNDKAFLIVAPYGSGKSLTFTYLLNVIENRTLAKDALNEIERRFSSVSDNAKNFLLSRRVAKNNGLVFTLHGFQENLPNALKEAVLVTLKRNKLSKIHNTLKKIQVASMQDAIDFLRLLISKLKSSKCDILCILWDETGRHLETLVNNGRASELSDIQILAEFVNRISSVTFTLALSLHQSMIHYAQNMSQSIRNEWLKISGRFKTIQYIDDSKELYRLVSEIISSSHSRNFLVPTHYFKGVAENLITNCGIYSDFTRNELTELIKKAYPVNPVALFLLPRVSARVSQNERTLFTFLNVMTDCNRLSVSSIYDYFSTAMRSDTAIGGTYKQWLETESAISKTTGDSLEVEILKTACLLGFGAKGERTRTSLELLKAGVSNYSDLSNYNNVIHKLISKKLLLYRKHNNDVSVWHGTDVDLRGKLAEEMERQRSSFDYILFLNNEEKPIPWKPIKYNAIHGIRRYWSGRFVSAKFLENLDYTLTQNSDGQILYIISSQDDYNSAIKTIKTIKHDQSIFAINKSVVPISESALEVFCLLQLKNNSRLISEDPLVLTELMQMLDDSRANLNKHVERLTHPNSKELVWFYKSKKLKIVNSSSLRNELSKITSQVFSKTPIIHNELINRNNISATIVNSRKKLIMGILERHGSSDLGLKYTSPEASMFRTILVKNRLYIEKNVFWDYSSGIGRSFDNNPGLTEVWGLFRTFFSNDAVRPKRPIDLFELLQAPPIGLRKGLIPIFFAAGLKSFGKSILIKRRNEYIKDVLPSTIEDICKKPQEYTVEVIELSNLQKSYLSLLEKIFGTSRFKDDVEKDLIRAVYDVFQSWIFILPRAAFVFKGLSSESIKFRDSIRLFDKIDPYTFLFKTLPSSLGMDIEGLLQNPNHLLNIKFELENTTKSYMHKASKSVAQAIIGPNISNITSVQALAKEWASSFKDSNITHALPGIAKGLINRMIMSYDNEEKFIDSLALLILGKSTDAWDDSKANEFESKLNELTRTIESHTISKLAISSSKIKKGLHKGLSNIITTRIEEMVKQLTDITGENDTKKILSNILEKL